MLTIAWIIFLSPTTTSATQSPTSSLHTRHYPNSDLPIYQVEIVVDGPSQTTIDTQYQVCANTSNYRNASSLMMESTNEAKTVHNNDNNDLSFLSRSSFMLSAMGTMDLNRHQPAPDINPSHHLAHPPFSPPHEIISHLHALAAMDRL
ncbi:hypothetical protein O0I10_012382 [Lichtheimia ornata]|uniref:Uncharacterized protein n=1 Tax=Lichtheimia ornata TaxID=688661 RepID=A0AAD7XVT9_9FUNG|nr:uncharacterized protein O0I10_012382 [Lichtheimia ornata]KAJ8652012.1 hypothetical protein O0I10_012382 [Lichtheimia ornata]